MGWSFWPERREEWPVGSNVCVHCHKPVRAGDKFYVERAGDTLEPTGRPIHATCEWKRSGV